jgi:hypothetical protein
MDEEILINTPPGLQARQKMEKIYAYYSSFHNSYDFRNN